MLLELARIMQEFASVFALFNYITMRAILSALTALALTLLLGPGIIGRLAALKAGGQPIRTDGPQTHFVKAGTAQTGTLTARRSGVNWRARTACRWRWPCESATAQPAPVMRRSAPPARRSRHGASGRAAAG